MRSLIQARNGLEWRMRVAWIIWPLEAEGTEDFQHSTLLLFRQGLSVVRKLAQWARRWDGGSGRFPDLLNEWRSEIYRKSPFD